MVVVWESAPVVLKSVPAAKAKEILVE